MITFTYLCLQLPGKSVGKSEWFETVWSRSTILPFDNQLCKKINNFQTRPSNTYILYASRSVKSIKYTPNTYHTQKEKRKLRLGKIQQRGYSLGNKEKIVDRSTQRLDLTSYTAYVPKLQMMVVHSDIRPILISEDRRSSSVALTDNISCRFANSFFDFLIWPWLTVLSSGYDSTTFSASHKLRMMEIEAAVEQLSEQPRKKEQLHWSCLLCCSWGNRIPSSWTLLGEAAAAAAVDWSGVGADEDIHCRSYCWAR